MDFNKKYTYILKYLKNRNKYVKSKNIYIVQEFKQGNR